MTVLWFSPDSRAASAGRWVWLLERSLRLSGSNGARCCLSAEEELFSSGCVHNLDEPKFIIRDVVLAYPGALHHEARI